MIHGAIMGSIERFMSVIIEHYAGAFPLWLSPVQVKIIPIHDAHHSCAEEVHRLLLNENIRVELDTSDENLGKKVRVAKVEKIPYWVVIGDKEVEVNKVNVESRKGNLGQMESLELIKLLREEIQQKSDF